MDFGAVVPSASTFTICSGTRYSGGHHERILTGSDVNWLHGHWGGRAGIAYFEGWLDTNDGRVHSTTDWVLMCSTAGSNAPIVVNGNDYNVVSGGGSMSVAIAGSEVSEFEIPEKPNGETNLDAL